MSTFSTAVSTGLATVLGGAIVVVGNYQTARMAARRDHDEWRRRRADIRTDEQRAAIKDLQDAVSHLYRLTGRVHIADVMAAREDLFDGQFGAHQIDDEISDGHREALVRVRHLESRVGDAELRRIAGEVRTTGTSTVRSRSEESSAAQLARMGEHVERLDARVTTLLDQL